MLMFFIFISACLFRVKAQSPKVYTIPSDKLKDSSLLNRLKDKAFNDSLRNVLKYRYNPYRTKPLAGSMPRKFNYLGSNRQGFDIYQTPLDNMYILRPDPTFVSNMPIAGGQNSTDKPIELPNLKKERRD